MREQAVEDQQVAGLHLHVDDAQARMSGCIGSRSAGWVFTQASKSLNSSGTHWKPPTSPSCFFRLSTPWTPIGSGLMRGIDIPVDEAVRIAFDLPRRIEVGAIDRDPKVLAIPDVDKGVVDALLLPVVPEILVIVDLQHAGVVELLHLVVAPLRRVPGRRDRRDPSRRRPRAARPAARHWPPARPAGRSRSHW